VWHGVLCIFTFRFDGGGAQDAGRTVSGNLTRN
jgi:hypothetical protein